LVLEAADLLACALRDGAAYSLNVFRRLPAGHPKIAHQYIGHLGSESIARRRMAIYLCIKDAIDLGTQQPLRSESIDEFGPTNLSCGALERRDDARADGADFLQQTRSLITVSTSHLVALPRGCGLQVSYKNNEAGRMSLASRNHATPSRRGQQG
jgi:hypothetical protein